MHMLYNYRIGKIDLAMKYIDKCIQKDKKIPIFMNSKVRCIMKEEIFKMP